MARNRVEQRVSETVDSGNFIAKWYCACAPTQLILNFELFLAALPLYPSLALSLSQVQSSLQTSLKLTASDKNSNSRPSPSEEGRERGEGERAGLPGEAAGRETAQERLRGFAFSAT